MRALRKSHDQISAGGKTFDALNVTFMILLCAVTIYPFWYVLIYSLNEGSDAMRGQLWLFPRKLTWDNYRFALQNPYLSDAFLVTVLRVLIGTVITLVVNLFAAYALSKRDLPLRKPLLFFFLMPMFIGGTVVSNYLVMAKLGLINHFLVYVLPGAFAFFTMIIMRTFLEDLPEGLEESAMIDGAGTWNIFWRIILPLSKPILAAFGFFSIVGHWLDFSANLLYVTDRSLYVLQYILYMVVKSNEAQSFIAIAMTSGNGQLTSVNTGNLPTPEVLKMAVLMIVTLPLLFVYPFFQRYFVKGMMVGAIKA